MTRWYNADGDLIKRRVIHEVLEAEACWSNPLTGKTVPYTQNGKITTVLAVPGDFDSATETTVGENIYTDPDDAPEGPDQQHGTRGVRGRRHARVPGRDSSRSSTRSSTATCPCSTPSARRWHSTAPRERGTMRAVAWTVLIVDDHAGFRAGARALLEADGFDVLGEAADGESARRAGPAPAPAGRAAGRPAAGDGRLRGGRTARRGAGRPGGRAASPVAGEARSAAGWQATPARGFITKAEFSGRVSEPRCWRDARARRPPTSPRGVALLDGGRRDVGSGAVAAAPGPLLALAGAAWLAGDVVERARATPTAARSVHALLDVSRAGGRGRAADRGVIAAAYVDGLVPDRRPCALGRRSR